MPKRILIIDDDEDILDLLNLILKEEGYEVVISNTAETANHIQGINPDLILLDIRINGSVKHGDQICSEIKSSTVSEMLPVILLSAELDVDIIAKKCGADAYINKPFDVNKLIEKINQITNRC